MLYNIIERVHDDDIHGLAVIKRPDGLKNRLISGSKDTTIKLFDEDGKFLSILSKPRSRRDGKFSYAQWVTALDAYADGSFVGGHRNGFIICKSLAGRFFFGQKYSTPITPSADAAGAGDRFYKPRNQTRIMSVKCLNTTDRGYHALVGTPEAFFKLDCSTGEASKPYRFDMPEWVYGFEQLPTGLTAAIHGCRLSLFRENDAGWENLAMLFDAEAKPKEPDAVEKLAEDLDKFAPFKRVGRGRKPYKQPPKQRPFIASVKTFEAGIAPNQLALSLFGGTSLVLDVSRSAIIHRASEHTQRVWQTIPKPGSPNEYVSCADDASIKIWDIRAASSVATLDGHPGRVSALAFLDETRIVSGTCAADPSRDPKKAQFWFYDLRGGK